MKQCRTCGKKLPLSEYYEHKQMLDGYLNICKDCTKERVREHRRLNLNKIRQYDRQRGSRQSIDYRHKYRAKYPKRDKAQTAVGNAIRDGRLDKPDSCSVCGRTDNIHGHHPNYTRGNLVMSSSPQRSA